MTRLAGSPGRRGAVVRQSPAPGLRGIASRCASRRLRTDSLRRSRTARGGPVRSEPMIPGSTSPGRPRTPGRPARFPDQHRLFEEGGTAGAHAGGRAAEVRCPARAGARPAADARPAAGARGRAGPPCGVAAGPDRLPLPLLVGAGLDDPDPGDLRVLRLLPARPPDA